jgi:hypothetical protein
MQPSSIGLAVAFALTLAPLGPANAGFIARSPHMMPPAHIIPPAHMIMANHIRQFGNLDASGREAFRRGRDRRFPSLGFGYPDGQAFSSPADTGAPNFAPGAPVVNVTIVTAGSGAASSPSENYVASARPKIILIGARPRVTHFEKLPIVIYGRS